MQTAFDQRKIKTQKRIYRVLCGPDWFICDGRKEAIQRAENLMQFRAVCGLERYPVVVTCETIIWVDGEKL